MLPNENYVILSEVLRKLDLNENYQPTKSEQEAIKFVLSNDSQHSNQTEYLAKIKNSRIVSDTLNKTQIRRTTHLQIPKFRFIPKRLHLNFGYIEMNGEKIHEIQDLHKFHQSFGYTKDIAKKGILPDEFIWEKYFKDSKKSCSCFELNFIEYLSNESAKFKEIYNADRNYWSSVIAAAKLTKKAKCSACKTGRPNDATENNI